MTIDSPDIRWALKQLEDLMIEEDDTLRLQPCFSPVWDTALTLNALADAGMPGRSSGRGPAGLTGYWSGGAPAGRLERAPIRDWSRRAGSSSTAIASIRTSTTRPWC